MDGEQRREQIRRQARTKTIKQYNLTEDMKLDTHGVDAKAVGD